MLKYSFALLLSFLLPFGQSFTPEKANLDAAKIQIALLLDTSNSMDGLIDQAKAQLWKMVNKLGSANQQGETVMLEIALFEYGNDGLVASEGYVRMVQGFGMDLDGVSEQLFKLKTNGGNEFCGWVIQDALEQLEWTKSPDDLHLIIIAGNEPFDQGKIDFRKSCKLAAEKGIIVNTIFCGDYEEGARSHWKDGAVLGLGRYMNIDSDQKIVQIPTPYDSTILRLNDALNATYIGYGAVGKSMKSRQMEQDQNAGVYGSANVAQRATAKAKKSYKNDSWDLVDAAEADTAFVSNLKVESLPAEWQGKSKAEIEAEIVKLRTERAALQKELLEIEAKMNQYIAAERAKVDETQTLDNVLMEAVVEQARAKGFEF